MRWLFLLLLVANIIFFLWNWIGESESGTSYQEASASVLKGKRLVLLSELESSSPEIIAAESNPALALFRTTVQKDGICYVLGPFRSDEEAERAVIQTESTPAIVERRWNDFRQEPRYWVHVPPASTARKARNAASVLHKAGIPDVQIITSGKMKHTVSLGVFATLEEARKLIEEVKKQGFDASINKARIKKDQYWLALRHKKNKRLSKTMLDKLVKNTQEAKVERRSCGSLYQQDSPPWP